MYSEIFKHEFNQNHANALEVDLVSFLEVVLQMWLDIY